MTHINVRTYLIAGLLTARNSGLVKSLMR